MWPTLHRRNLSSDPGRTRERDRTIPSKPNVRNSPAACIRTPCINKQRQNRTIPSKPNVRNSPAACVRTPCIKKQCQTYRTELTSCVCTHTHYQQTASEQNHPIQTQRTKLTSCVCTHTQYQQTVSVHSSINKQRQT